MVKAETWSKQNKLASPHGSISTLRYVRDLVLFRGGERHLGHSSGGGYMVILLLVFLAATVVTGLIVYGGDQQAGPLAGVLRLHYDWRAQSA